VDFGVFCSYKYLNSGAGCVAGMFVHSNHFDKQYPRLDGWWGNRDETRFQMKTGKNYLQLKTNDKLKKSFFFVKKLIGASVQMVIDLRIHLFINVQP